MSLQAIISPLSLSCVAQPGRIEKGGGVNVKKSKHNFVTFVGSMILNIGEVVRLGSKSRIAILEKQ